MFSMAIILMYLLWGGFIAIVFYGLYRVLLSLLDKYIDNKNDYIAAIREQNQALKEIASAIRETNDNKGTPPEVM